MNIKKPNALKVANIGNALKSEQIRNNTPFLYRPDGEGFYFKDGKEIPESIFNEQYPLETLEPIRINQRIGLITKKAINYEVRKF